MAYVSATWREEVVRACVAALRVGRLEGVLGIGT